MEGLRQRYFILFFDKTNSHIAVPSFVYFGHGANVHVMEVLLDELLKVINMPSSRNKLYIRKSNWVKAKVLPTKL